MKVNRITWMIGLLIWTGGCTIPNNQEFKLGVPHVQQEEFNYCVPASILMWRLYDGLPAVSQEEIFDFIGGPPCTPDAVPAGVNHYTNVFDARLDLEDSTFLIDNIRDIVARQITWSTMATV